MNFKKIFETKKSKQNKQLYTVITKDKQMSAQTTQVNYKAIVEQGYKGNWIIFRCLQEIIRASIQIKFKVVKVNTNGEEEEIKGHKALNVLNKPNPLYSRSELIKRAILYRFIGGDAPFHRVVNGKEVTEIYVYKPNMVTFKPTGDVLSPYRDVKYNNETIEAENFMLWKEFNANDDTEGMGRGMSVLQPILKNGDLLNELVNWNIALLQNGGNLSGIFTTEQILTDIEYDKAKATLKNEYAGVENTGKLVLLEGGTKFIPTSSTPKDMDWIEGKKATTYDICIGLGVDPILIGLNESSTYNNKNEAEKGLYTKNVIPLMQDLAEHLGEFLILNENERLVADYSHIPCLQEDMQEMAEILSKSTDMTINEKRAKRGLEPLRGGDIIASEGSFAIIDGKVYLTMNLVEAGEEKNDNDKGKKENKSFMY